MSSATASDDDDYTVTSDFEDYNSDDDASVDMDYDYEVTEDFELADEADKGYMKAHEIEFRVVPLSDILAEQSAAKLHVAGILGLSVEHALALLRSFKWNKEKLLERYVETPEEILHQAGVVLNPRQVSPWQPPNDFLCAICFGDDSASRPFGLRCGHLFCHACYEQYVTQKVVEEGECRNILCPESGCSVIMDEQAIRTTVKPTAIEKYQRLQDRAYVSDLACLRWCPAPNCENAVECRLPHSCFTLVVPTVLCTCGCKFCFGCGLDDHQPAPCGLVKLWQKKCADDSETANWIMTHTKECGKCQSTIEKNGGCNHMTCRKCKYEFCWVCLGSWTEHGTTGYSCNRFEDTLSPDVQDQKAKSRASLERYLHYYNRFTNHEHSANLDQDLYVQTEKTMEDMQRTSDLSWIEVQFLKEAVDVLTSSRTTLRWTYAFAFYLASSNQTTLFEDNQRDLEVAVEALSELVEKPIGRDNIAELRAQVLDKAVYVRGRRDVLLEDAAKGLAEGRWEFLATIASPSAK
ncbi:hypothetical protein BGZ68_009850 [Mortierella alpina]|nr:hypothetical protein BGZ68_009850 [Mortierella alpina]